MPLLCEETEAACMKHPRELDRLTVFDTEVGVEPDSGTTREYKLTSSSLALPPVYLVGGKPRPRTAASHSSCDSMEWSHLSEVST